MKTLFRFLIFFVAMLGFSQVIQARGAGPEICFDGIDNDGNGTTDVNDGSLGAHGLAPYYQDADGDGYGTTASKISVCSTAGVPSGYIPYTHILNSEDCDDTRADVYPYAPGETCDDGIDTDCSGNPNLIGHSRNDAVIGSVEGYLDWDGDGYGSSLMSVWACPSDLSSFHMTQDNTDCQDFPRYAGVYNEITVIDAAAIHPGATELCNGHDDNCDGVIDEGFDADGDGQTSCNLDCDDTNFLIMRFGHEVCNGVDDDCDGIIDNHIPVNFADDLACLDADGDGYGDINYMIAICDANNIGYPGYVDSCMDCDDSDASVGPWECERETGENCGNGGDDDGDGLADAYGVDTDGGSHVIGGTFLMEPDPDCFLPDSEWEEVMNCTAPTLDEYVYGTGDEVYCSCLTGESATPSLRAATPHCNEAVTSEYCEVDAVTCDDAIAYGP